MPKAGAGVKGGGKRLVRRAGLTFLRVGGNAVIALPHNTGRPEFDAEARMRGADRHPNLRFPSLAACDDACAKVSSSTLRACGWQRQSPR